MVSCQLKQPAPPPVLGLGQGQHFIFDGTFLRRPRSLIALMDARTHMLVAGQYDVSENSKPELIEFFEGLKQSGLNPRSFTVDGNRTVMGVLRQLWPDIVLQRCLVHIQRQGLSWCRTSPKTTYARWLRQIFLQVARIRTPAERDTFLSAVTDWELKYGSQIGRRRECPAMSSVTSNGPGVCFCELCQICFTILITP